MPKVCMCYWRRKIATKSSVLYLQTTSKEERYILEILNRIAQSSIAVAYHRRYLMQLLCLRLILIYGHLWSEQEGLDSSAISWRGVYLNKIKSGVQTCILCYITQIDIFRYQVQYEKTIEKLHEENSAIMIEILTVVFLRFCKSNMRTMMTIQLITFNLFCFPKLSYIKIQTGTDTS